jgi:ABC-type multidrug transport system permease subunit
MPYLPQIGYFVPEDLLIENKGLVLHNIYLSMFVDYGPLSFILFIILLWTLMMSLVRKLQQSENVHHILPAVLAMFLCITIEGFFDDSLNLITFWIIMALATYYAAGMPAQGKSL